MKGIAKVQEVAVSMMLLFGEDENEDEDEDEDEDVAEFYLV